MHPGKSTRPKIIFCDNSLRELINFRLPVIQSYLDRGWDVVTVAPANREAPDLGEHYRHYPVKLSRAGNNPIKDIRYLVELMKVYRRERPDYIFHYTIKPNIYGTIAAHMSGLHSSAMIAGLGYAFASDSFTARLGRLLYKTALRHADRVFVLNSYNLNLLRENKIVKDNKLILLPGGEGIDLNKFNDED